MKRLLSLLLSMLIVGTPTVAGAEMLYRNVEAELSVCRTALHDEIALNEALRSDKDALLQNAVAQLLEEQRIAEEKAAEEAAKEKLRQAALSASPAAIDLAAWQASYPAIVGYIYNPGTALSYPIAYTGDHYYLHHNLDGVECVEGAIYMEPICNSDFSSGNTILYGHHMKNGSMFASICYYKNSAFYYDHPCMYLYTNSGSYRLDLIAGFPCPHDDDVFCNGFTDEQVAGFRARSTFSGSVPSPGGSYVTLVTCSYEADNYRYVLIGQKTAL